MKGTELGHRFGAADRGQHAAICIDKRPALFRSRLLRISLAT